MELANLIWRLPRQWYYSKQRTSFKQSQGALSRSLSRIVRTAQVDQEVNCMGRAKAFDIGKEAESSAARFRQIYDSLRDELEASHAGEYVVINVLSSKYVVARWPDEAMDLAEAQFGSSEHCWSKRIGTP